MKRIFMAVLLPMLLIGAFLWPSPKMWACEGNDQTVQVQQQNQAMPGEMPVLATFESDLVQGTGAGPPIANGEILWNEISWTRQGVMANIIGLEPIAATIMLNQQGLVRRAWSREKWMAPDAGMPIASLLLLNHGQCLAIIVTIDHVSFAMVQQGGAGPPIAGLNLLDSQAIREDDEDYGGLLRLELVRT